jgi:peroxiredoxin
VVRHEDGRPASEVPIRLLFGRQLTTAVGRTNGQGRWQHTVSQTGAYDLVLEAGPDAGDPIRVPITVLDAAPAEGFPWITAGPGIACQLAGLFVFFVGIRTALRTGARFSPSQALAMAILMPTGAGLLMWSAWHYRHPALAAAEPDMAAAAREFLRGRDVEPLSGQLERLLTDTTAERVATQPHSLLNKPAPGFELADHRGNAWRLSDRLNHGPVVLVFYYGYHCNHCVGQLFALHDDMAKFRELGALVLAVSADPPELTKARFKQYGEFAFPVLTDPGNKTAQAYGVYHPRSSQAAEELRHGTFVIGRDGKVLWAQYGSDPFTGNRTLLYELARSEGRLPSTAGE